MDIKDVLLKWGQELEEELQVVRDKKAILTHCKSPEEALRFGMLITEDEYDRRKAEGDKTLNNLIVWLRNGRFKVI